jgi:methionyl-tRNA formyltransferase
MGTPEFAVPCLRELCRTEDVTAVFTKPDKPKGRGNKMLPSPVKNFAVAQGIACFSPATLKTGADADEAFAVLSDIKPDLIIVTAYGQILPERILSLPNLEPRCINLHGSILPKYRGAAPIERAVLEGETETGITSMVMAAGLDTGDILLCERTDIGEDETAENLRKRLSELAAQTLLKTLNLIKIGKLTRTPQRDFAATYAHMLDKEMCRVDFSDTANNIHNLVRAVTGFAYLDDKRIKLYRTHKTDIPVGETVPGELSADGKQLLLSCSDKRLEILELQTEGGKRVSAAEFLRGHKITAGTVLKRG